MENRSIPIDLAGLCIAIDNRCFEHDYFLDLETGAILSLSDTLVLAKEVEELRDAIEQNPNRYKEIPKAETSYDSYDVDAFIHSQKDDQIAESIIDALDNEELSLRRFKYLLAHSPALLRQWFSFRDERKKQRALTWLDSLGVSLIGEKRYSPFMRGQKLSIDNCIVEYVSEFLEPATGWRMFRVKCSDGIFNAPLEYSRLFQPNKTKRPLSPMVKVGNAYHLKWTETIKRK